MIQLLVFFYWIAICTGLNSSADNQLVNWGQTHPNNPRVGAQTAHGITYPSLTASQGIGTRGPVLLQDVFLLEKLQTFNRERIPERVVHAKGAGAFGYFEVTHDITRYTKANFLQRVGQRTNVAVRFSTTSGQSGAADTFKIKPIDSKGFAVKFYTNHGIFDLVGNNIQVFPVRDPSLFVDLSRSRKRNPQTHLADPTMWWDFASLRPETALHILYLFSDMGAPQSLRFIDGAGVHTFKMVNIKEYPVYVKFHWKTNQAQKYFTLEEAKTLAGSSPDLLTKDLYDAIERQDYPSWNLFIQVMTFDQAIKHPQNPFDSTKFWKPEDYPLLPVGKMVLNRNPLDYFAEVEQLAFSPSHMVPGIEPSPDRLLHARMFAYPDSQVYRLGTNFAHIPVNRCPFQVQTYQRYGFMNVNSNGGGEPNYYPNSFNGINVGNDGYQTTFSVCGEVDRIDTGHEDNFSLANFHLANYVDNNERKRIVHNIAAFLGKADVSVQNRFLHNVAYKISNEFGASLKQALDI